MSYDIYVQKFVRGESDFIPFDELNLVLQKYGRIEEGDFGFEFISIVGEVCDCAFLSGESLNSITGISFERPTESDILPNIIFDLLSIENTCFFGTDLQYCQSRTEMKSDLPESILNSAENGLQIITTSHEAWPLR